MLEALCGNKNIQRILLFLFVNNRCYGTQLHKALRAPLTPLQKALSKLEKGGVVVSYNEGKTRIYQFNPVYPLIDELTQLLKKAYTMLPAEEKKGYYVLQRRFSDSSIGQRNKIQTLMAFWSKLEGVSQLTFNATTKGKGEQDFRRKGKGEVIVKKENDNKLVYSEKGDWQGLEEVGASFTNVFRWTLDKYAGVISLEHLRRGPEHPVFLFHLAPISNQALASVDSHLCGGDSYFGQVHFDQYGLRLNWRVIGPKKNEELETCYS